MSGSGGPDRKRALIVGISGQDGAYLARHLLERDYEVWGTSRGVDGRRFHNLERVGVRDRVRLVPLVATELQNVVACLSQIAPDEIYNLAAQSSVALSFDQPSETFKSVIEATQNLLEAIRVLRRPVRFYSAGSSEVFGDDGRQPSNEQTRFHPRSPYGVAKAAAYWQVSTYRESYGLFAVTGILFNHESPLRPERFVTSKIVHTALRIAQGKETELRLGDTEISRDWGWAPEYVDAMWRMLQADEPRDLVIATGHAMRLGEFVDHAFGYFGLDSREFLRNDRALTRPNELRFSSGDASAARESIEWAPRLYGQALVERLCAAAQAQQHEGANAC